MSKSIKKPMSKQKGLTLISWVVIAVFLMFQAVIAMNVIPVYMNDAAVKSIMEELPNDDNAKRKSVKGLAGLVSQRLRMNNLYAVKQENIKVKKGRNENIVTIEYEPRGKLIGSLEYIVKFKHEAKVKTR